MDYDVGLRLDAANEKLDYLISELEKSKQSKKEVKDNGKGKS